MNNIIYMSGCLKLVRVRVKYDMIQTTIYDMRVL